MGGVQSQPVEHAVFFRARAASIAFRLRLCCGFVRRPWEPSAYFPTENQRRGAQDCRAIACDSQNDARQGVLEKAFLWAVGGIDGRNRRRNGTSSTSHTPVPQWTHARIQNSLCFGAPAIPTFRHSQARFAVDSNFNLTVATSASLTGGSQGSLSSEGHHRPPLPKIPGSQTRPRPIRTNA